MKSFLIVLGNFLPLIGFIIFILGFISWKNEIPKRRSFTVGNIGLFIIGLGYVLSVELILFPIWLIGFFIFLSHKFPGLKWWEQNKENIENRKSGTTGKDIHFGGRYNNRMKYFSPITEEKINRWEERKRVKKLIKALYYKDDMNIRYKAIIALEKIGKADIIKHITNQLDDTSIDILNVAKRILLKFSSHSIKPLISLLNNDSPRVCDLAFNLLLEIGHPVIDTLISDLLINPVKINERIIELMSKFREEASVAFLFHVLLTNNIMRNCVIKAFANMGEIALNYLLKETNSSDSNFRFQATIVLGELKATEGIKPLITLLNEDDKYTSEAAYNLLVNIGDPSIAPLINELESTNSTKKVHAIKILGKLKAVNALDPLSELLLDKDATIREEVVKAILQIEDEKAKEPLMQIIKSENDENVRKNAVLALGKLKVEEAVEPLILLLDDSNKSFREDAFNLLISIGEPSIALLIKELKSNNFNRKIQAIRILGKLKAVKALDSLSGLLLLKKDKIREEVVKVIGLIQDNRAAELLLQVVKTEKVETIRQIAAYSFAKLVSAPDLLAKDIITFSPKGFRQYELIINGLSTDTLFDIAIRLKEAGMDHAAIFFAGRSRDALHNFDIPPKCYMGEVEDYAELAKKLAIHFDIYYYQKNSGQYVTYFSDEILRAAEDILKRWEDNPDVATYYFLVGEAYDSISIYDESFLDFRYRGKRLVNKGHSLLRR